MYDIYALNTWVYIGVSLSECYTHKGALHVILKIYQVYPYTTYIIE